MSKQKNKKRIFVDFDGTIVDIRDRYYAIYRKANLKFNLNIFSKKTYWGYKTKHCSEKEIILKNNKNLLKIDKYLSFRSNCIENKKYLAFDKLIIDRNKIGEIVRYYNLYLITMRHNKMNLLWETRKMNIYKFFKEILCREALSKKQLENYSEMNQKEELLSQYYPFSSDDILIGDTELDYLLGKYFKLQTFIVNTGVCNKKTLLERDPKIKNILYKNINSVLIHINRRR